MGLFQGYTIKAGSKSNTKLVVSGGDSPAEKWIADPTLPVLFNYTYGGPGQEEVVISKGQIVALTGDFYKDHATGKNVPVLSVANGTNVPIGMAPFNIAKHDPMFLKGNQPAIITREYVELPYIPNTNDAQNVKYGAVIGLGLKPGDYLKATADANNKGKVEKWVDSDPVSQRVAQVLAIETDQEPLGWLKWAQWDETAKAQDDSNINLKKGTTPGDNGYPFDPSYKDGTLALPGYMSDFVTNPNGIPGLTDGAERSKQVFTKTTTIPANAAALTKFTVNLDHKNLISGTVVVKRNGVAAVAADYTVNYRDGQINYTLPTVAGGSNETLTVEYRAYFMGTLPGWDFQGSVGAVRLLLKF